MSKNKNKVELNDIYTELAYLRAKIDNVSNQMQELRESIRESSHQDEVLRVSESYEHPWYKYKREELIAGGNYTECKPEIYSASVEARYGVSGAATTTQGSSN